VAFTSDPNEIAFGCEKGLFFGTLDNQKVAKFKQSDEQYFNGKLISQLYEYMPDQLIVTNFF